MKDLLDDKSIMFEMVEHMDCGIRVINRDNKIVYMNKLMKDQFGDKVGKDCYAVYGSKDKCEECISKATMEEGRPVSKEREINGHYYKIVASPVEVGEEERYSIEMFQDITEKKHLEVELLAKYNQLKKETEVARNVQRSILPEDGIYWDAFRLNSIYLPADDLGGDIYDIVKINDDKTLLYIADVAGHGVHASLLTVFLRQVISSHASDAEQNIGSLIRTLLKAFNDLDISGEMYFSVLFCLYNRREQSLAIANAGHNCFPIIVRDNGRVEEIQVKGFPISKLSQNFAYPEEKIGLYEGERVVLFTDGIVEEYSEIKQKPFGSEGIRRIVEENHTMEGKKLAQMIIDEAMGSKNDAKDDRAIVIADVLS